LNNQINSHEL